MGRSGGLVSSWWWAWQLRSGSTSGTDIEPEAAAPQLSDRTGKDEERVKRRELPCEPLTGRGGIGKREKCGRERVESEEFQGETDTRGREWRKLADPFVVWFTPVEAVRGCSLRHQKRPVTFSALPYQPLLTSESVIRTSFLYTACSDSQTIGDGIPTT